MSADMELHARKTAEAKLHDSDWMNGQPLDIGDGYSVAFHSDLCMYCAFRSGKVLTEDGIIPPEAWATTKAN